MQHSNDNLKGEQAELIKWQNSKKKSEYIIFRLKPPNKVLSKLNKSKSKNTQKLFHQFYSQIQGGFIDFRKPLLQSQQIRNSILQNNIVEFGGIFFSGVHDINNIKLKLKLYQIQNINFNNIKNLLLSECKLESIQIITWLNLKHLNTLNLTKNNIVSLKPFSKGSFVQLERLYLERNKFVQLSNRHLPRFHSLQLNSILFVYAFSFTGEGSITDFIQTNLKNIVKAETNPKRCFTQKQRVRVYGYTSIQNSKSTPWIRKVNQHSLFNILKD